MRERVDRVVECSFLASMELQEARVEKENDIKFVVTCSNVIEDGNHLAVVRRD